MRKEALIVEDSGAIHRVIISGVGEWELCGLDTVDAAGVAREGRRGDVLSLDLILTDADLARTNGLVVLGGAAGETYAALAPEVVAAQVGAPAL